MSDERRKRGQAEAGKASRERVRRALRGEPTDGPALADLFLGRRWE